MKNNSAIHGPYIQSVGLSSGKWFIVPDLYKGDIVQVIVKNGQQRSEGIRTPSVRDAKAWMKDNGFVIEPQQ